MSLARPLLQMRRRPTSNFFGIPEDNPNPWKTVWEKLIKQGETLLALGRFFPFPISKGNAKMSMELKSTGLGSRSFVLKSVYPPAVLASQKMIGLSWDELAGTALTSLFIVEENEKDPIMRGHDAERDNKNHLINVHGQAPRCDDEMSLAMLDANLADLVSDGFDQGRRMGCDEERKRTRHFFHDVLSSKILVASFLAQEIYQNLTASKSQEAEEMARLTKLLQEAIDAIVQGAEEH